MKKQANFEVSIKTIGKHIKIYIDGVIHIQLPYLKSICVHSYSLNKDYYCIEFRDIRGNLLVDSTYSKRELWIEILNQWDKTIK